MKKTYGIRWICGSAGELESEIQLKTKDFGRSFEIVDTVVVEKEGEADYLIDGDALLETKVVVPDGLSSQELLLLQEHFDDVIVLGNV